MVKYVIFKPKLHEFLSDPDRTQKPTTLNSDADQDYYVGRSQNLDSVGLKLLEFMFNMVKIVKIIKIYV